MLTYIHRPIKWRSGPPDQGFQVSWLLAMLRAESGMVLAKKIEITIRLG